MRQEREIQILLLKFIQNECNTDEIETIIAYIQKVKGITDFPSLEEVKSLLEEIPEENQKQIRTTSSEILEAAKKRETISPVRKLWKYASVAAIFIGVLTTGYFYQQGYFDGNTDTILIPAQEAITLELDNGTIEVLNTDGSIQVVDAKGNVVGTQQGNQMVYSDEAVLDNLVYNTLKVPYGKRFDVVLSDGTQVYLNSGTTLKYPVSFVKGMNREIFVTGEAYFDVTKDAEHPFIVNATALNVEVLGTQFNVLSYPEDASVDVVLVEGSVGMYSDGEETTDTTILSPGLKGSYKKSNATIQTEEVSTAVYTSWRNGELVFRNIPFTHILKKLERQYNVSIVLENEVLGQESFSASFDNETIENVLSYFDEIYGIQYEVKDNTVYIK